jgi:1-acyl-sn-glycerol-3-phosphate acyltransferase
MQTIYYKDELKDEFSAAQITPKRIDGSYDYSHDRWTKKAARFFWYKVIAKPLGWIYLKIRYNHKIVNREVLKQAGENGYYLYANHTKTDADPFIPTIVAFPKDVYVIVHPNNVSMPVIGKIMPYLGALPLPDDKAAMKNFSNILRKISTEEKSVVMIYPEAHIWPYYTGIRPFTDSSFRYPLQYDKPVYCFTNTYQKRRFRKTPQMVTYVDGPFLAPEEMSHKEKKTYLRNQVYEAMCERSKENNVEMIRYIKVDG